MAGFCHPIHVHEIEHVYCHCNFFQWRLGTIVAIFQQYVYYYAIEFRSVCHVRLHNLSRIKNYFHTFIFLTIYVFVFSLLSVSPFVHCFSLVCPCFCLFLLLSTVFLLFVPVSGVFPCFWLFSLFLSVFSCYPMVFLFSSQSVFPCSTVFICFQLFPGAFFSVFSCFLLFLWILLSFPVLLCSSLFFGTTRAFYIHMYTIMK